MWTKSRCLRMVGALLTVTLLVGCNKGPRMGRFDYRVSLDEKLRDPVTGMPSIEVDFVAVKGPERGLWDGLNIDDYFVPGNPLRADADRHTLSFTNDNSGMKTMPANASEWGTWSGAEYIYIIASIPLDPSRYAVDPRRISLPLSTARWEKGQAISIAIKPSGVKLQSEMIPEKTK